MELNEHKNAITAKIIHAAICQTPIRYLFQSLAFAKSFCVVISAIEICMFWVINMSEIFICMLSQKQVPDVNKI